MSVLTDDELLMLRSVQAAMALAHETDDHTALADRLRLALPDVDDVMIARVLLVVCSHTARAGLRGESAVIVAERMSRAAVDLTFMQIGGTS